jgi:hypothetical protein
VLENVTYSRVKMRNVTQAGASSVAYDVPPTRRFRLCCQCDAGGFLGEAHYSDDEPHEWLVIDRVGVEQPVNSIVLDCPACRRHHARETASLVRRWEADGCPKDLLL